MVLFSEDHIQETKRRGRIEVICGSMFSGKTEEYEPLCRECYQQAIQADQKESGH